MAKCLRCGYDLIKVIPEHYINPDYANEYEFEYSEYACPHCGTYYTVEGINDDEKNTVPKYNKELEKEFVDESHGYEGLCPECGRHIVWSSDFMRSEIIGDVDNEDDDALVSYVYCPYCGSFTEIIEAKPSELVRFPIYKELNKDGKD